MDVRRQFRHSRNEQGAVAMIFALALPVMLGMMALALDLSYKYVRRTELQQLADSIAVAAAAKLNGTALGVTAAKGAASAIATQSYVNLLQTPVSWDPASLQLATSIDSGATWVDASSITADPQAKGYLYAKVDTTKLTGLVGEKIGLVDALMGAILDGDAAASTMGATAIAGPTSVQVTPLAICAISPAPNGTYDHSATGAANEALEYGFRRGVSYNLLDLGPTGTAQAYLVNPVDPGTGTNDTHHFDSAYVKRFFCNGTMAFREVGAGSKLYVTGLTLEIKDWLNSRFNDFSTGDACPRDPSASDTDVREYIKQGTSYPLWYMAATPDPYPRTAAPAINSAGARVTVADLPHTPAMTPVPTAASFGPLWAYSRPGATTTPADWPRLYANGAVTVPITGSTNYPGAGGVPYQNNNHKVLGPSGATKDRRVLNIPLLECPGGTPAAPAKVLGIGRFFMTAKAITGVVPGEFAGVAQFGVAVGSAALYK
jgi:Flp pilus assembly protein TadG